jgi:hypothetical protein
MSTVDDTVVRKDDPVVRRLSVGTTQVGEIRLHLRRGNRLSESDQHAFSTFADAAASAFHDAATHRTLRAMTARSAYDALHDSLTGLSNRSTLLARGNTELSKLPPAAPVALVMSMSAGCARSTTRWVTRPGTSCWPSWPGGSSRASSTTSSPGGSARRVRPARAGRAR